MDQSVFPIKPSMRLVSVQQTTATAETIIAETTTLEDKLYKKATVLEDIEQGLFTGFEDMTSLEDKKGLTVFSAIAVVCCIMITAMTKSVQSNLYLTVNFLQPLVLTKTKQKYVLHSHFKNGFGEHTCWHNNFDRFQSFGVKP